ncbi:hypothetical protein C5F49_02235 [Nitrosopumilus oxyclinae]|uniref:Uncharacterized protein n=1 Tax=Nitrosopumilus oxyclinae TaxID=1959104 RepID=A0A7D5R8E6_9ARCH|nr:hypothetical protein [Nitrosopumilus oxyclinae]QLH04262.1 hypothetical protein C5F49_02235 [Nitrosopumilus oxyclinae]
MKTEHKIILVMIFLTSSTLVLIYQNPDGVPKSISFEKHSDDLVAMNQLSKKYQLTDDEQKFENSKRLMQEKLKEISLDYMGLKITHVELLEGYYPFQNSTHWAERFDLEPSSVCDFERKIPLHMQKLMQTENFKIFTKKYASHDLELSIQDERSQQSNIHYGLFATNNKNQSASTYFHLSSCTDEITDKEPLYLHCFDGSTGYRYNTHTYDDIISSYSNGEFCNIILDPWRQSLYDYSQTLREKLRQLEQESMGNTFDQESHWKFFSEMNKQGELRNIVGAMIHGKFDEQRTQDMIKQYEKQYGSLSDELLELIEKR